MKDDILTHIAPLSISCGRVHVLKEAIEQLFVPKLLGFIVHLLQQLL